MTTNTTIDLGNNETLSSGVHALPGGLFLALTFTASKTFKTRKGAEKWLAARVPAAPAIKITLTDFEGLIESSVERGASFASFEAADAAIAAIADEAGTRNYNKTWFKIELGDDSYSGRIDFMPSRPVTLRQHVAGYCRNALSGDFDAYVTAEDKAHAAEWLPRVA